MTTPSLFSYGRIVKDAELVRDGDVGYRVFWERYWPSLAFAGFLCCFCLLSLAAEAIVSAALAKSVDCKERRQVALREGACSMQHTTRSKAFPDAASRKAS